MTRRSPRRKFPGRTAGNNSWLKTLNKTEVSEDIMQMACTFMAVVAGMIFSLAVALLAEELIFGQVFRLFFASGKLAGQTATAKSDDKAAAQKA